MSPPARIRVALAGAAAVLLLLTACGGEDGTPKVLYGNDRIGTFPVKADGSLNGLIDAFGRPSGRWHNGNGCVARWLSYGFQVALYNLRRTDPCTETGGRFLHAEFYGPGWKTANGLAVGDSFDRARQLFPRSKFGAVGKPRGSWLWLLRRVYPVGPLHYAGLAAKIVNGRVVALRVQYPADGV